MTADTEANGRRDRFRAIAMAYGGHEKEPSHSSLQEPRAPGLRRAAAREDIMTEEATGRGVRAADSTPRPLSPEQLDLIHAYWRAANYLSVGQIYLMDNPLLAEPLRPEHIKPRLLGHWGTTPGLNFIYAHLNRVIRNWDLNAIYVTGPGHGGPGIVANTYLEGTYSEVYPDITQDAEGMRKLFRQFSFPGGIPSHVAPETPGSINEGGELGYSLLHAYGAAFDNPDLLVCCVIGDGEAETGPLAASWHSNKFLDPIRDGAVLPILHLNGYKIASPTVLARISEDELRDLLKGYGYEPHFVSGDDPPLVHQRMAAVLDQIVWEIQAIQRAAREGDDSTRPRWPMIVLRTPKGWTGPREVDGLPVEGTFRAHQVPITQVRENPEHLALLESWMRSYRPVELFDEQGTLVGELKALPPKQYRRMSANPHTNGGLLLRDLRLPDFRQFAVDVPKPGTAAAEATRVLGAFLRDVTAANPDSFRLVGSEETEAVGVGGGHVAQACAQNSSGLGGRRARLGHVDRELAEVGQSQIAQEQATVSVRVGAHAAVLLGGERLQLPHKRALFVEELHRTVAAHPRLEQRQVLGVLPDLGDGHLVGAEGTLDRQAVDLPGTGPTFGRAQDDHGPAWPCGVVALAGGPLDGLDLPNDLVEHRRHALVDERRIVATDG